MKAHTAEVFETNRALTITQRTKYKPRYTSTEAQSTSLAAFNEEDVTTAMNEYGRITRRDMFRGFTTAQRRRIIQDNEVIMKMRR